MADFTKALVKTLLSEGGYVNNPTDRGKETYKGISRRWNPKWGGWAVIDSLRTEPNFPRNLENHQMLQDQVAELYKIDYWDTMRLDAIKSQELAERLFDIAVNMGLGDSVKILQQSVNLLNKNQRVFANLSVDGKIGSSSIKTVNSITNTKVLLETIKIFQGYHYIRQCEEDESQEEFFCGWIERLVRQ